MSTDDKTGTTAGGAVGGIVQQQSGGSSKPSTPKLPEGGSTAETQAALQREFLRQLLAQMGIDLPTSMTDVQNASNRLLALKEQTDLIIQDLINSGQVDEKGGVIGIPDDETVAKLHQLDQLQQQMQAAAEQFATYAVEQFGPKEDTTNISQSTILDALNAGLITKDEAGARLGGLGMRPDEVALVLGVDAVKNAPKQAGDPPNTYRNSSGVLVFVKPIGGVNTKAGAASYNSVGGPGGGGGGAQAAASSGSSGGGQARATGSSGSAAGSTILPTLNDLLSRMQPAMPRIQRLPSPTEFLADFGNAFDLQLSKIGGGFGTPEMEFARTVMMPGLMSRYTSELAKIAASGQSPFHHVEVDPYGSLRNLALKAVTPVVPVAPGGSGGGGGSVRLSGGSASGGGGGSIVSSSGGGGGAASGGVVSGVSSGSGVIRGNSTIKLEDLLPREFVAIPNIMPGDFLAEHLTEANIRIAYEASRRGAGQFASSGTGTISARRI